MGDAAHERLKRAVVSLVGLGVGDSFGEQFFLNWEMVSGLARSGQVADPFDMDENLVLDLIEQRALPQAALWRYTDDTQMALSIVENLRRYGRIHQDELARSFSRYYIEDSSRGYGPAMHAMLPRLERESWRELAPALFNGEGSFGNGAAMRVAPVGAYFSDDLEAAALNARLSAEVTHSHPEAVAGAIAVAVAAALVAGFLSHNALPVGVSFLNLVLPHIPASDLRERVRGLCESPEMSLGQVVEAFGSGQDISAQDTVPFVLWCVAQYPNDYEEALWLTVSGLGDRDTTCAMVGGIVALYDGVEGIPAAWRAASERLPEWPLRDK